MIKKSLVMIIAVLAVSGSVMAADSIVLWRNDTGAMYSRDFIADGSGGLVEDGSNDAMGTWATGSANWIRQMGDLNGDGVDSAVLVSRTAVPVVGRMISKEVIPEVGGDGGYIMDPATQDELGDWGGSDIYTRLFGDLNGDGKDSIVLVRNSDGTLYSRGFIADGSGGLVEDGVNDAMGIWLGTGYQWLLGDINGNGTDSLIRYNAFNGALDARDFVPEIGGDGGLIIGSTQDGLGTWATNMVAMLGDLDGNGVDSLVLVDDITGQMLGREFVPESGGDGGLIIGTVEDDLGAWGTGAGVYTRMLATIPEPATGGLFAVVGGALFWIRRRRG